jgi:RNA polymerase sigma factor (sigma-70 family)
MAAELDIEAMYRKHGRHVLRRAYQILGGKQEADDVLQDVFTDLLARPHQYNGASTAGTFLYAVTTNACLDRLRKQRNRDRLLDEQVRPWITEIDPCSAEAASDLRRVLGLLTDDEARAAIYSHFDHMSQEEIAKLLGCSASHVRQLLKRIAQRTNKHKVEL